MAVAVKNAKAEKVSKELADALGIFSNAPAAPFGSVPKKKGKKDRDEVNLGPDLDDLAALKIVAKAAGEQAEQLSGEIKERVRNMFADSMIENRKRPDSFLGTGEISQASCELRKATSLTRLDDSTIKRLNELGIATEVKEDVPERWVINPALVNDQDSLKILAEVLTKEPRLKGKTIVMKQDARSYTTVGESALDDLSRIKIEKQELLTLLEKISVIAVGKFQLSGVQDELKASFKIVQTLLGQEDEA